MAKGISNNPKCFLAMPVAQSFQEIREVIQAVAQKGGYDVTSIYDIHPGSAFKESVSMIAEANCVIADISEGDSAIFFELGLSQAMGKGILLIANEHRLKDISSLAYISTYFIPTYTEDNNDLSEFAKKIESFLEDFRKLPQSNRPRRDGQISPPFFVDWDNLNERDAENLCRELLSNMGFRKLDWGKGSREIDMIAELPKKDPDGFEYRELWLISMGLHIPIEQLMDMASEDTEFLLHRLLKYSGRFEENAYRDYGSPLTLLFIVFSKGYHSERLEMLRERIERRRFRKEPYSLNVRLRIWDQDYLTSLVHKFPNIGYKYFSDEGRIRSKTRKSYEDLYLENSELSKRQAFLINELENEKNQRIRAERDSVWKDISFSAAHKIGNPIFAIETDLNPLLKRINEDRKDEAKEVVDNIRSAVEKAKSFVEQFKSLAKAQEIKPVSLLLWPLLEDACKLICNQTVNCEIKCHPDVKVQGDPERLAECFDELVINATYWLDKPERKVWIEALIPAPAPLPDFLDSSKKYVLIHFRDNGPGIQPAEKDRIFDAFFTKRNHGTGLGLALVRRIIDGHGGGIIEVGSYGQGADFEVFLPMSSGARPIDPERKSISGKSGPREK